MKADPGTPKTWDEWTDILGNTYRPGDIVAVSTINGKSPQLVIARVERINRVNSSGEEITARKYLEHPEPIEKIRECYDRNHVGYSEWVRLNWPSQSSYVHHPGTGHDETCQRTYMERGEYLPVPSCTVKAKPLKDARGFRRWSTEDEEHLHRAVTYSIPANIIKLHSDSTVLDEILKRANEKRFNF